MMATFKNIPVALAGIAMPLCAFAAGSQPFSDVTPGHALFPATTYLHERGILSGYPDPRGGPSARQFRPGSPVNRAEAIKLIISPSASVEELSDTGESPFTDVGAADWYGPYVEVARIRGVIDGPPVKNAFHPNAQVLRAEFLKMLQLASGDDPHSYGEFRLPLAADVQDPDAWYYPSMRFGIATSMLIGEEDDWLGPGDALTRGELADLLHRFLLYREGERTQAMLTEIEEQILLIIHSLEIRDIHRAEHASARALLAARGAHAGAAEEKILQAAVKIAEAYRALVMAYTAGVKGDYDGVIKLAGDAWSLAERAEELSPALARVATQVQLISAEMADRVRERNIPSS